MTPPPAGLPPARREFALDPLAAEQVHPPPAGRAVSGAPVERRQLAAEQVHPPPADLSPARREGSGA